MDQNIMLGNSDFLDKTYEKPVEKIYNDDLINGGSSVSTENSVVNNDSAGNLSEQIIRNIAVEKELSEIASAYNLHRNEGDVKKEPGASGVQEDSASGAGATAAATENVHLDDGSNSGSVEPQKQTNDVKEDTSLDINDDTQEKMKPEDESSQDVEMEENGQDVDRVKKGDDSKDGDEEDEKKEMEQESNEESDNDNKERVAGKPIEVEDGVCRICQEEFNGNDIQSINKHLGDKHVDADNDEIYCGVCQKEYTERRGVIRHLLNIHLEYKPHKCEYCGKQFARKDHLNRHVIQHSPRADRYDCKFCTKDFARSDHLNRHLQKYHMKMVQKKQTQNVVIELSGDENSDEDQEQEEDDDAAGNNSDTVDVSDSGEESGDNQNDSDPISQPSDSDSDEDKYTGPRKSTRVVKTAAAKRPKRVPMRPVRVPMRPVPPKKKPAPKKKPPPVKKPTKKEIERELAKKKREEEAKRKQREKMRQEERALAKLRERARAKKQKEERELAKEKQLREEMQKKLEEQMRKQKEIDEGYFDSNFIEPAKTSMKFNNNVIDDDSVNYTNYYGGNFHEPPKKTLAQVEMERSLLIGFEAFQGLHFLSEVNAAAEVKVKMEEHIKTINPDSPQGICGLCGEEYDDSDTQALSKHIYEKHIDNTSSDRKCAICGKEYTERKGLNRHMLHYHLNYKPHRCEWCPKCFSRKDHLTRHMAQHSDDKGRFQCEFCEKTFTRKEHLNRHLFTHKDTFKYKCEYCTKAYTRMEHLQRHVKDSHFVANKTEHTLILQL